MPVVQSYNLADEEKQQALSFQEKVIPYVPAQLKFEELGTNGKLLSDADIARLETQYAEAGDCRPSKEKSQTRYRIVKANGEYYAVMNSIREKDEKKKRYLGDGGYAKVEAAQNLKSGRWYALKTQHYSPYDSYSRSRHLAAFENELNKLEMLGMAKSKIITREVVGIPISSVMLMELIPGLDLEIKVHAMYKASRCLSTWRLLDIALQLSRYVLHLYRDLRFLHGDIKLENLLLDFRTNKLSLIDVAFAGTMDESGNVSNHALQGTRTYMAPEIFSRHANTEKSEVFALGTTIAALFGYKVNENGSLVFVAWPSALSQVQKVTHFLNLMLKPDASHRADLASVVSFFEGLQKELFPGNAKKIGFIRMEDFTEMADDDASNGFFEALADLHEVHLVSCNPHLQDKAVLQFSRRLAEKEVYLHEKFFILKNMKAMSALADGVNQYFYFTPKKINSIDLGMPQIILTPNKLKQAYDLSMRGCQGAAPSLALVSLFKPTLAPVIEDPVEDLAESLRVLFTS